MWLGILGLKPGEGPPKAPPETCPSPPPGARAQTSPWAFSTLCAERGEAAAGAAGRRGCSRRQEMRGIAPRGCVPACVRAGRAGFAKCLITSPGIAPTKPGGCQRWLPPLHCCLEQGVSHNYCLSTWARDPSLSCLTACPPPEASLPWESRQRSPGSTRSPYRRSG